jgi:hypothetical protein
VFERVDEFGEANAHIKAPQIATLDEQSIEVIWSVAS